MSRSGAWLHQPDADRRWDLPTDVEELIIGRQPGSDILIDHPDVSRQHATLRRAGQEWLVVDDPPSSNGTYVNGSRVTTGSVVRDGDRIAIGRTALTFHQERDSPATGPKPPARTDGSGGSGGPGGAGGGSSSSLVKVLLVAGAVNLVGLVGNSLATLSSKLDNQWLRWLVPNVLSLVIAMVGALIAYVSEPSTAASSSGAAPRTARRGAPPLAGFLALVLVLTVGGVAVTWGVRYGVGLASGNESGVNVLVQPRKGGTAEIRLTVNQVTYTRHFTRVDVTAQNLSERTQALPLFESCQFIGSDGFALKADSSRSDWSTQVAAGVSQRGVIVFPGRLAGTIVSATLAFTFPPSPKVTRIRLNPGLAAR